MSHGLVVCFSGRIASGKSSIAAALSRALVWPKAGFGDYLRDRVAREGGDPNSRQALQDLGQSLVAADPAGFCADVLSSAGFIAGGNLVLDGIRHVNIHARIAALVAPSKAPLIHLAVEDLQVRKRVVSRTQGTVDLQRAEAHQVESELSASLPEVADHIIDANQSLVQVITDCLSVIELFGADAGLIERARTKLLQVEGH